MKPIPSRRLSGACAILALAVSSCADRTLDSSPRPDLSDITSIRLDYQYSGWSHEREQFILIPVANSPDFRLTVTDGGIGSDPLAVERVPADAVARLVGAASDGPWSRQKGVRAVAATIRRRSISAIAPGTRIPPSPCTTDELKQRARDYVRREGVARLIDKHYGQGNSWTDDYPHAQLQILYRSRAPLRMHSDSQKYLMLPWCRGISVNSPAPADQDWSLALIQAMQGVLPKDSSFYQRLAGDKAWHLKHGIEHDVRQECEAEKHRGEPQ
ncbi:MAG: hypothetical protein EOP91_13595 [Lysobacteraceae bacterium]|nr:MAG: hypothetical protein EOP91_13595 [Xanthomonadaceae bacterium]